MILSCLHHARTGSPLLRQSCIRADHSCSFARCFNSALVILTPPQYNSSGTFRNVPLLLSHACPCAGWFDGYLGRVCSRRTQKAYGTAMCLCASLSRRRRGPAGLRDLFRFCRSCGLYALRSGPFRVCEARGGITTLSALYVLLKRRTAACKSGSFAVF